MRRKASAEMVALKDNLHNEQIKMLGRHTEQKAKENDELVQNLG